jgi:beta-fructofuranosidase
VADLLKPDFEEFRREAAYARASLQSDPHRPQYHFTAPCNWLNDPNGLIQWQGQYHLFYQHNPSHSLSATKHWGHAVSSDLVHWDDMPIALAPTPDSYDADGIYSGSAVDDDGMPAILYSGIEGHRQRVCLATGDKQLLRWRKYSGNPVIADVPSGLNLLRTADGTTHYRDPSVWREDGSWWMIVGSGISNVGGTVLLYRSPDLRTWEYLRPLLIGDMHQQDPIWKGTMWECPQLFPLGDRHVLLISIWHERQTLYPAYMTGSFNDGQFIPEHVGVLDVGSHYAPQTFRDDQDRRIMFGWLREQRSAEAMASSGWNGAMTVPWLLSLGDEGSLRYLPASELKALRENHRRFSDLTVASGESISLQGVAGDCLEVQTTIAPGTAASVGLVLRRGPDGVEETRIVYQPTSGHLFIDRIRASLNEQADRIRHEARLTLAADEPLRLTVFLDRSVLELVANQRVLLSERIYPTRVDSSGVAIFADGGSATFETVDVWDMRAIWTA